MFCFFSMFCGGRRRGAVFRVSGITGCGCVSLGVCRIVTIVVVDGVVVAIRVVVVAIVAIVANVVVVTAVTVVVVVVGGGVDSAAFIPDNG